jgi:hypothetical protein
LINQLTIITVTSIIGKGFDHHQNFYFTIITITIKFFPRNFKNPRFNGLKNRKISQICHIFSTRNPELCQVLLVTLSKSGMVARAYGSDWSLSHSVHRRQTAVPANDPNSTGSFFEGC